MKTTLLILFSSCLGLLAQTPATTDDGSDPALRDALLRTILRGTPTSNGSTVSTAPAPAPTPAPAVTPTAVAPAAPVQVAPVAPPAVRPVPTFGRQAAVPPPANLPPQTAPAPADAGAAAVAAAAAAAAIEQPGPPEEATNSIDFPNIDLTTFLDVYSGIVGRTVLRSAGLQSPPLTLRTQKPVTRTELIQAMNTVLALNGIGLVNKGSNFFEAVMQNEIPGIAAPFSYASAKDLPEAQAYVAQIVPLKYIHPSDMIGYLQPFSKTGNLIPIDSSQILIIRDYADNVKRMLELVSQIDIEVSSEFQTERIPIKYAQAGDIANAISSLGGSTTTGIPRAAAAPSGRGVGGGNPAGYPGGGTGLPGGVGTSPPSLGSTATAGANQSFAARLRTVVNGISGGSPDFKLFTGITKIMPDERSNSLLVFANESDLKVIKRLISQLDVILPQVLIEAIIMEVNVDDERNIGVSYLQTSPSTPGRYASGIGAINNGTFLNRNNFIGSGTNAIGGLPSGLSYAASFGNDFDATITAVENDSRINVLSRPRVQTSHGVPASLQVGDTIPYISATYGGGLNGINQSSYQQTFVGIDLEVTPLINSDGLVVMDITQDIEQLGPATTIDGNSVPSTTKRAAKATVSVLNHDTVILGGFISSTKSKSLSGVPVLMNVPVLGSLFRSTSDTTKRVELIVLIRPTVLPNPEDAALAAAHERDRMPGVKAAQKEYQIDENRRLKEADKIRVPNERE